MVKNYAKAHDIGNYMLKNNRNNADVIKALRILKRREFGIQQRSTLNPINSQIESDSECEENDSTDFVDDNINIHLDPIISTLRNTSTLCNSRNNKTNLDYKPNMHRVILLKTDIKQNK
ncbi:uncharacterized protein LOC109855906 isoform X2 [Pseudomyrmex gracilis]|nr:uncharacterized protein LOC109855906 isoform X2 [Pseudomyrmex gracilis]XP_020286410.1 uncharacterized protein LOC109855906 isoform X2 [Pseudomyrmex gracilis]XP_020286502.1 uncharacterized protein LOC109855906 isoform X2 [Pseudomyrmex gracilis]XP_020286593.1 uncharacterized protein LOC109855906 isoform X2 [Pseudomyrmex gracilis]